MINIAMMPDPNETKLFNVEALMVAGWQYRDIPWCTPAVWDEFLEIAGEGNYHVLARTTMPGRGKRGQVLISPEGMARFKGRSAPTPVDLASEGE